MYAITAKFIMRIILAYKPRYVRHHRQVHHALVGVILGLNISLLLPPVLVYVLVWIERGIIEERDCRGEGIYDILREGLSRRGIVEEREFTIF
jgi:hypothetical protein